jgi:hypothetical protein
VSGVQLFRELCQAEQPAAAIRALAGYDLAHLIAWLRAGHRRGVAALLLGLAELEAADRFVTSHDAD